LKTQTADVAIIGGGLIGLLTARELALAGKRVCILESGQCGKESSWAGGGILSPLYPWRYSEAVNQLAKWSQPFYRELSQQLHSETGIDPEWTLSGILLLDMDEREQAYQWATSYSTAIETVTDGIRNLEPGLNPSYDSALWFPDLAQVRNPRLVAALIAYVKKLGVQIFESHAVKSFTHHEVRIVAAETDAGSITAEDFVIASGAWSAQLISDLGIRPAVRPIKGQMLLYQTEPGSVSHMVMRKGRYVIPRRDGRVLVGSTLEDVGFDKQTTEDARESLKTDAENLIPMLKTAKIEKHWAGLRPGTQDGIPYICKHPQYQNCYLNTGHFRNGVVLGPASARHLATLLLGETPLFEPYLYQL